MQKYTKFYMRVYSRHPSIKGLRKTILLPMRAVYRHGSTTDCHLKQELNSVESVKMSSNKLLMKQAFNKTGVITAEWIDPQNEKELEQWALKVKYPIVAKSYYGSRGTGNTLIKTPEELNKFVKTHGLKYVFEKFYNYVREYRLHVDKTGYFYACRKMLKRDTPENERWYRNDSNCEWFVEENPQFNKPKNWNQIVTECVKALHAVGLDVGACDVKTTSSRETEKFIVIEINSAPSMGERTIEEYKKRLPIILKNKYAC